MAVCVLMFGVIVLIVIKLNRQCTAAHVVSSLGTPGIDTAKMHNIT